MKTDACQSNIEHLQEVCYYYSQSALIVKVRVEKFCILFKISYWLDDWDFSII